MERTQYLIGRVTIDVRVGTEPVLAILFGVVMVGCEERSCIRVLELVNHQDIGDNDIQTHSSSRSHPKELAR